MNVSNSNKTTSLHTASDSPHTRANEQLTARGLTAADLTQQTLSIGGTAESFLAGESGLTPAIAFGLSRLTGLSATYWVGLDRRGKQNDPHQGNASKLVEQARAARIASVLSNTMSAADDLLKALQAAGEMREHTLEVASALVATTMRAKDPLLFRAALETTVAGDPALCRALAQARICDPNPEISHTALWTLYGIEPGQAIRHAYDCVTAGAISEKHEAAAMELLAFHARVVVPVDEIEGQDIKARAANTCEYVRRMIESGSGDPHIIQAPGYPFVQIGEACRLFFQTPDTSKRLDAIKTVVQSEIPVGACIALAGVKDLDPVIRANSLAALRLREPLKSLQEAQRLLEDVDGTVRDVAKRVISSFPGNTSNETE